MGEERVNSNGGMLICCRHHGNARSDLIRLDRSKRASLYQALALSKDLSIFRLEFRMKRGEVTIKEKIVSC